MYLRSLRLKGFKSFPAQTELLFEPGVAVVIGPNGSGKSNIADAVVWALGEQSPTTVRGSSMQDVIFVGSEGRRGSAAAEVELVFDNADGALSVPTSEVSVGRRVERNGDTTYRINRATCRLADVLELTAEMGLGRELHSIIGQGKVEAMLASRPSERRALVEEAAGLGLFKRRRERSDLKLREVRRNVERARDLEREAALQLAPLRRQANAAESRRKVERDIAETRGRLLSGELDALDLRIAAQQADLGRVAEERDELGRRLAEAEAARRSEEERFAEDLREREHRGGRAMRARYLGDRLESCVRLTEQRARLIEEVGGAGAGERDGLRAELESGAGATPSSPETPDLSAFEEALRAAERAHGAAVEALSLARREAGEKRAAHAAATLECENVSARLERLRERRATLAEDHARAVAELGGARVACGEALTAVHEGERRGTATRAAAAAAVATVATADEALEAARTSLVETEEAARRATAERAAIETEIEHTGASLRDLQDVDEQVLAVARAYPGAVALSAALSCEPGYERALGAALAQYPGALAVGAAADHWSLLDALRDAGVRLARLVLPGLAGAVGRSDAPPVFPGAVPLTEKVSVDDGSDLERLLAAVVIVDDLHGVPEGFPGLAVTRDGSYFRPAGGQLGLAAGVPAALLLERRARLEELNVKVDALRAGEARAVAAAARARVGVEGLSRARAAAAEALTAARREADAAGRLRDELDAERRSLEQREARLSEAAGVGETDLEQLDGELVSLEEQGAGLVTSAAGLAPSVDTSQAALDGAEEAASDAVASLTRARIELEERRAAVQRALDERERATRRAERARARLAELDARLAAVPGALAACAELQSALQAVGARASGLGERLSAAAAEAETRVHDRSTARRLAEQELDLRRAGDDLVERRAAAQVESARLEERRTELATRFDEVASVLETNVFEPPSDGAEVAALGAKLERLERRRDGIGPVNPLAEAECSRLQEHVDFLREQTRDLEKSVAELEALIAELTERIESDFNGTFAIVCENFGQMVAILFPGGTGRLSLTEPEAEGEPGGVAIEVKPARKLGKKLALLSGGERSLVALAFLMALLLAKTCPFSILDEVEAALDDINIGLFVSLVREYRERTQFVIITHQKRTMSAADVLYGVTMGPDGTSQVVSARMAEEQIEHEEDVRRAGRAL